MCNSTVVLCILVTSAAALLCIWECLLVVLDRWLPQHTHTPRLCVCLLLLLFAAPVLQVSAQLVPFDAALQTLLSTSWVMFATWFIIELKSIIIRCVLLLQAHFHSSNPLFFHVCVRVVHHVCVCFVCTLAAAQVVCC